MPLCLILKFPFTNKKTDASSLGNKQRQKPLTTARPIKNCAIARKNHLKPGYVKPLTGILTMKSGRNLFLKIFTTILDEEHKWEQCKLILHFTQWLSIISQQLMQNDEFLQHYNDTEDVNPENISKYTFERQDENKLHYSLQADNFIANCTILPYS